ncbi:unnamed protein product [Microthlaspi erraticum]|uniref:Bifunctional inhibitor/plant lipid transfer protein/seed storage helical domain-containing protein n=1 Tax=Microthlaspi erraticum TaxID=1685480 RepID=A0A6D2L7Q2_9BRAS|nr:unnamed protein product [Microthlaspi erraticum]
MKFATFMLITFVIISTLSPDLASATAPGGFGEVAQVCDPSKLLSCYPAIATGVAPTTDCCTGLVAQEPCLCTYIKDPKFQEYVSSPNARKTMEACKVPYPTCT